MAHFSPDRTGRRRGHLVVLPVILPVILLSLALLALTAPRSSAVEPDPVGRWPLQPEPAVVRGFDPPSQPFGAGHRGVDLSGTIGQPVRAALPGAITYAGRLAGRGVVVVGHGPTRTTYEPVAALVRIGDVVAQGDRIGVLELAGSHCFPAACLHWGWLRGDDYLNPLDLVGRQPVRLLPLGAEAGGTRARDASASWVGLARSQWHPLLTLLQTAVAVIPPAHPR